MPGPRTPLVGRDGRLDPTWYRFMVDLHERTGGAAEDKVEEAAMAAEAAQNPVQLSGATLSDASITPTDAEVGYRLTAGGKEQSYTGISAIYVDIGDFLLSGAVTDYEYRLTVNSGTTPAGSPTGSWETTLPLAWTLTDTIPIGSTISNNCTIEIRNATTQTVQATGTVTMSVVEEA